MTNNRTNEELAERLRQFAESQAMDFDSPHVAMTLNEVADRLVAADAHLPSVEQIAEVIAASRNSWAIWGEEKVETHVARAVLALFGEVAV